MAITATQAAVPMINRTLCSECIDDAIGSRSTHDAERNIQRHRGVWNEPTGISRLDLPGGLQVHQIGIPSLIQSDGEVKYWRFRNWP